MLRSQRTNIFAQSGDNKSDSDEEVLQNIKRGIHDADDDDDQLDMQLGKNGTMDHELNMKNYIFNYGV